MGLDDLFGQGRNQQRQEYGQRYGHDDEDDSYQTSQSLNQNSYSQLYENKLKVINSMANNPKVKLMLIIAAIVIIAIIVFVIILLFPLIIKLFNYIGENGLQGILDTIWKGTK
jgi:uncharacterized membrane protein YvbJ